MTTGRISSEMLLKTAKMKIPIAVSLTSPTERAVWLACDLGIALYEGELTQLNREATAHKG